MQRPYYVYQKALWPAETLFMPSLPRWLICNDCYRPSRSPAARVFFFFIYFSLLFFIFIPAFRTFWTWLGTCSACVCVCVCAGVARGKWIMQSNSDVLTALTAECCWAVMCCFSPALIFSLIRRTFYFGHFTFAGQRRLCLCFERRNECGALCKCVREATHLHSWLQYSGQSWMHVCFTYESVPYEWLLQETFSLLLTKISLCHYAEFSPLHGHYFSSL